MDLSKIYDLSALTQNGVYVTPQQISYAPPDGKRSLLFQCQDFKKNHHLKSDHAYEHASQAGFSFNF